MLPNSRFTSLLADIEPSSTTKGHASAAHTAVRSHLRSHAQFKDRWEGDFLAGSYSRDTAIRPRHTADGHDRPDVDIIIETSFSTSDAPDDVLNELADALRQTFHVERINKRSVRVLTANSEIDVVPVVPTGSVFELPDRDLGRWKTTNPPGHNTWSSDRNKAFSGRFKPLVKLFKWWRRENKTGKRPKGFVLEVLVSMYAPVNETHYGEAFARMLEGLRDAHAAQAEMDIKPFINDPGLWGNDILSKVSMTDWKAFMARVKSHAALARRAQNETDEAEATRLWRIVLGERFPKGVAAVAAKATAGSTVAVAPVAASAFVFPDVNATPTSPRGFA
ncbi:hypothetical protein KPL74_08785 [Bacillus sp. NP157]|nr:hypothetical protein KPL74_08785 [Bacillus sp. NP157]